MSIKIVLALFVLLGLFCAASAQPVQSTLETQLQWAQFKQDYGHTYATQPEADYRYQVFLENLGKLSNAKELNPEGFFGMTEFMDLTSQEFVKKFASPVTQHEILQRLSETNMTTYDPYERSAPEVLPAKFDWRQNGEFVTDVKDQGACGSCWAFAATEVIESAHAFKNDELLTLSPQSLIDCAGAGSCGGGFITEALDWAVKNAVVTEESYPYTANDGFCREVESEESAQLIQWQRVKPSNGPTVLKTAIMSMSPAAFGVFGDMSILQTYQGGVISDCGTGEDGHAMVLVGWTVMNGKSVWIARNSWSESYGYNGYLYFSASQNACGINNFAYVATAL
jgi:C1A family cysteine protease